MALADIQAAFGAPAPQPAPAPTGLPPLQPGHRWILTAFGPAQLPDTAPLPAGAQYIDPATGRPYPPLNPPGEATGGLGQPPAPAPAPQANPFQPPAASAPQVTAVAPQNTPAPSPFLAPAASPNPALSPPAAVEAIVMPDPPKPGRTRTRKPPNDIASPVTSASTDLTGNLSQYTTEEIKAEMNRRGWTMALGDLS